MSEHIHHISGRLRLKFEQLRNNPDLANSAVSAIRRIDGVVSVKASTITGSLWIRYDARGAKRDKLLQTLLHTKKKLGLSLPNTSMRQEALLLTPRKSATVHTSFSANVLTEKILAMLVEKCIERSAIALVAALL